MRQWLMNILRRLAGRSVPESDKPESVKKALSVAKEVTGAIEDARGAVDAYWKVQEDRRLRLARIDAELQARRRRHT